MTERHNLTYTSGELHALIAPLIDVHDMDMMQCVVVIGVIKMPEDPDDYVRVRINTNLVDHDQLHVVLNMALHELTFGEIIHPRDCQED